MHACMPCCEHVLLFVQIWPPTLTRSSTSAVVVPTSNVQCTHDIFMPPLRVFVNDVVVVVVVDVDVDVDVDGNSAGAAAAAAADDDVDDSSTNCVTHEDDSFNLRRTAFVLVR